MQLLAQDREPNTPEAVSLSLTGWAKYAPMAGVRGALTAPLRAETDPGALRSAGWHVR